MRSWSIDRCRLAGVAVAALGALPSAAGELPHGSAIKDDPVPLAELRASLAASPAGEVVAGERLVYTITVRNAGAQPLSGVTAVLELPGETVLGAFDPGCGPAGPRIVRCDLGEIPAGGGEVRAVAVRVRSSATGSLTALLEARSAEGAEDADRAVTGVRVEACLALLGTAASETLFVGETTDLVFRVTTCGPSDSPGGELTVLLPPALVFAGSADGCEPSPGPRVRCEVPPIPAGGAIELGFVARAVRASAGPVSVTARLLGDGDPTGVHVAVLTSTVLAGPDLVLPFFEVAPPLAAAAGSGLAPRSSGPTTLLALQNLADEAVRVRLDVLSAAGERLATDERLTLCPRAVRTVNLRDLPELAAAGERGATGYAQIARIGPAGDAADCPPPAAPPAEAPAPPLAALAGDFLRLDPERGWASGGPLLATDPERVPRELCRRWSTRFSQAPPFGDDTEIRFWLGENPGEVQPVARGRIYDDGGNPVAEVALHSPDHVFAVRASELALAAPVSPPVLLSSGTIEWRFPPGVRGHVSTVRESFQGDAAAVPGTCLDPLPEGVEPRGREGPLVLPFVDLPVDLDGFSLDLFELPVDPGGETVRLTVRNQSARAALVELRYFDAMGGCVVFSEQRALPAKGALAIDLDAHIRHGNRFCLWQESFGRVTGYVEVQEVPIVDQNARLVYRSDLSADFVRISPDGAEAAGGSLIDTGPGLAPPQLCRRWSTRLIHGPEAETELTFYMGGEEENPLVGDPLSVTGAFRDETGDCLRDWPGGLCREDLQLSRSAAVFRLISSDPEFDLGATESFGTVEWTFPEDRPGHVTARVRSPGHFAAELPAVCLEP